MYTPIYIVADRGNLKVWRAEPGDGGRPRHLALVRSISLLEAHQKASDKYTDGAGGFPAQTGGGSRQSMQGNSAGERHYEIEAGRRTVRELARHVREILAAEKPLAWSMAAPAEILGPVLTELPEEARAHLLEQVPRDLVKIPADKLLSHFPAEPVIV